MDKILKIPTYIKKLNDEFDRLYEREWVNATDDVCMRPLDYPVSYDPMFDILSIMPTKNMRLLRKKGTIYLWNNKFGGYYPLKHSPVEKVCKVYEKVKKL